MSGKELKISHDVYFRRDFIWIIYTPLCLTLPLHYNGHISGKIRKCKQCNQNKVKQVEMDQNGTNKQKLPPQSETEICA